MKTTNSFYLILLRWRKCALRNGRKCQYLVAKLIETRLGQLKAVITAKGQLRLGGWGVGGKLITEAVSRIFFLHPNNSEVIKIHDLIVDMKKEQRKCLDMLKFDVSIQQKEKSSLRGEYFL